MSATKAALPTCPGMHILQPADRTVCPRLAGHLEGGALGSTCSSSARCPACTGLLGGSQDTAPETWSWGAGCLVAPSHQGSSLQGNPKPQASWTHNGHAVDSQRVSVRTGQQDSILFIRSAQRSDSGCYELTVRLEGLEAKAAINILVTGMHWEAARPRP